MKKENEGLQTRLANTVNKYRKKLQDLAKEGANPDEIDQEEPPEDMDTAMEVPIEEDKAKSFNGLAGEFYNLMHHMNRLPDLLLFLDSKADTSKLDDKESLMTQQFINEILNEAKGMQTPQKIMKHLLDIILKRKSN